MTLLLSDQDCEKLLSFKAAIPLIEDMFRMAGAGTAENPPRVRLPTRQGKGLQLGPAALHAKQVIGFKVRTDFGAPLKQRWDFLYSIETGELLAIIAASAASKFRTGAATAVAVKYLSPPTASIVGLYGSARQAEVQLEAICEVRPIREAHVYSPTRENREAFCRKMVERLGIAVIPMSAPEEVPRTADILVTITNSVTPVLLGDWIARPCLVVGAGANNEYERELDEKVVTMANLVVVDDKEAAKLESGDLLWPIAHGLLRWNQVRNLGDVVSGSVRLPDFSSGIILFESHGISIEDIAIATQAYELARAHGVGREITL